jgi:hypothetical protein
VAAGETETGPTVFSENNPLFLSLDAADGTVIWARSLPILSRGVRFNTLAEAPDGTLFAAGGGLRSVSDTGAAFVARIDPDGENAHHALIMEDELWDSLIPAATYEDTDGGDTAYDEIFDLLPVSGGFIFAGSTGLKPGSAGWVGKINHQLGVEWLRSFDGDDADTLDGIAATPGGYLASGFSESLMSNLPEDDTQVWVMKVAYDGGADLLPESGLHSRYGAPGIRASSGDDSIVPDGIVAMDAPLIVTDALPNSTTAPIVDLLTTPTDLCVTRLSGSGRESELDGCEPVPEPAVATLMASGLLALFWLRRGRS